MLARAAPPGFADAVSSGGAQAAIQAAPPGSRAELTTAANQAFISGLNEILLVGAAIAFVGGIAGWVLVRGRDLVEASAGPAPQPAAESRPDPNPAPAG